MFGTDRFWKGFRFGLLGSIT